MSKGAHFLYFFSTLNESLHPTTLMETGALNPETDS